MMAEFKSFPPTPEELRAHREWYAKQQKSNGIWLGAACTILALGGLWVSFLVPQASLGEVAMVSVMILAFRR